MSTQTAIVTSAFVFEGRIVTPGQQVSLKGDVLKNLLHRGKVKLVELVEKNSDEKKASRNSKPKPGKPKDKKTDDEPESPQDDSTPET